MKQGKSLTAPYIRFKKKKKKAQAQQMLNDHPHIDLYLTSSLRNFTLHLYKHGAWPEHCWEKPGRGVKAGTPAEVSLPANTLR